VNDYPIRLKREDAPPAPDAWQAGLSHRETLRALIGEHEQLARLCANWASDPVDMMRRIRDCTQEIGRLAERAERSGEVLMQAYRAAGVFSAPYRVEGGG
jgi:hypothetical protein